MKPGGGGKDGALSVIFGHGVLDENVAVVVVIVVDVTTLVTGVVEIGVVVEEGRIPGVIAVAGGRVIIPGGNVSAAAVETNIVLVVIVAALELEGDAVVEVVIIVVVIARGMGVLALDSVMSVMVARPGTIGEPWMVITESIG
jgi:hypothetical protein